MKKRVVTILILLSLTTCLLFGCAGEKGTGNGSSDSPVTSGQDNSIMETEPESGESLSGNAEEKEAEDVRVLFSLNQKVIETVLGNDDARVEMTESDIVIDQILYGSFSQPDADEVLIICKIMNMPHVCGLGRKAAIILETDSMNVVAYEELVADEVWVGIYDKAPIIHAKTMYLPYYNGHDSGHYIALSEVDMLNSKIKLVDCNRNNSYYGIHQESVQSVYDAVHEQAGRYLICLQY